MKIADSMEEKWHLLFEELREICRCRGVRLGLAESCTGGLLSAWVTENPGVSSFFQGSVVSYAGIAKQNLLGVSSATIQAFGEVSEPVARQMAQGARRGLCCDWAVSVTGIAGPDGGSPDKPVGTVCFAVVGPAFEQAVTQHFAANPGSSSVRKDIQRQAALFAFDFLLSAMR